MQWKGFYVILWYEERKLLYTFNSGKNGTEIKNVASRISLSGSILELFLGNVDKEA